MPVLVGQPRLCLVALVGLIVSLTISEAVLIGRDIAIRLLRLS